jgi:hypothetical protein
MNTVTVYFSLPFYPRARKTFFYHGHLALAINDTVYQLFDPRMLKSDFLISEMPVEEWLYGTSKVWCCKVPADPKYSYVYLYGCGEAFRTILYSVTIDDVSDQAVAAMKTAMTNLKTAYKTGHCSFNAFSRNCATFVADIIYELVPVKHHFFDFLPAIMFQKIIRMLKKQDIPYTTGIISSMKEETFSIHRICIGLPMRPGEQRCAGFR